MSTNPAKQAPKTSKPAKPVATQLAGESRSAPSNQNGSSPPVKMEGHEPVQHHATPIELTSPTTPPTNGPRSLTPTTGRSEMFPVDALGPSASDAAIAIQNIVQAPLAFIGSAILAVIALISQGHVNVETLSGTHSPTSLFFLIIGESGSRKTSADKLASAGIAYAEEELRSQAEPQDDAAPPSPWQYIISTGTMEGILHKLLKGLTSMILLNDDAGSFLGGAAMTSENRLKSTAWLSQIWDGSTISHTLADASREIVMVGRRLSVSMSIQPRFVFDLLKDGTFMDQGIMSRFLVTFPESNIGYREIRRPNPVDHRIQRSFAAMVCDRLLASPPVPTPEGGAPRPRRLTLSDGAYNVLAAYGQEVEYAQRPFGAYEDMKGPASKLAENTARIAGGLAFFEDANATVVSEAHAARAVKLAAYYAGEMKRLLDCRSQHAAMAAAAKLLKWLLGQERHQVTFKDLYQYGPFRKAGENRPLVQILETHGWLRRVTGNGNTGASDVWEIVRPNTIVPSQAA